MSETPEGAFTPFAHEELTKFYAEWPGGMDEVESALRGWRERCAKSERERDHYRSLAMCGCGDTFTEHHPGTCVNCLAAENRK